MIKIDNIKANGYKNIFNTDLELKNFNIITGANNSGKSNFLQIIPLINYIINGSTDNVIESMEKGYFEKGFGVVAPKHDYNENNRGFIEFEVVFSNTNNNIKGIYQLVLKWEARNYNIRIEIDKESLYYKEKSTTGKPKRIFIREGSKVDFGEGFAKTKIIEEITNKYSVLRILKIIANDESKIPANYIAVINTFDFILKTPVFYFSNIELSKDKDIRLKSLDWRTISIDLEEEMVKLKDSGKWQIFTEILKTVLKIEEIEIYDHIKHIGIEAYTIVFKRLGSKNLWKELSDGTVLLISLIITILSTKNDILFIEEPENSIHPKALIDLIAFLQSFENEKQIVINTHSIPIINHVGYEYVITANCKPDGKNNLTRIEDQIDLVKRLKKGYVTFSDELFFNTGQDNEIFE